MIPVVVINNVNDALPLGKAILDGDLNIIEVTFRTKVASECIKILSETYRDLIVCIFRPNCTLIPIVSA